MRLLAHRTEQVWKPAEGDAEVLVVGQDAAADAPAAAHVIVVGPSHRGEPCFVRYPFHADDLESALNALGRAITATGPARAAGSPAGADQGSVRLLRWPPANFLTSPARVRLAALLGAGAVPVVLLPQRSGCDAATCRSFLADLAQAGLITTGFDSSAQPPARRVEAGLLGRIRQRLGRVPTTRP